MSIRGALLCSTSLLVAVGALACSSSDSIAPLPDGSAGESGLDSGLDTAPGKDAPGSWTCTTDCSSCGPLEECLDGHFCVAKSVTVPAPNGGATYRIDAIEVTRCQYAAWLATNPSTAGQDPWCQYQTEYRPNDSCLAQATCRGNCANNPQVCIDSCAASAYCKAVGKRLCGQIGGGAAGFDDFDDATRDQWYNACSGGGQNTFPYGDSYDGQACNGYDNPQSGCQKSADCSMRPGGEVSTCQSPVSGYAGAFDLSGNVFEWQDSCNAAVGSKDRCRFRGGSYISSYGDDHGNALRCNYDIAGSRDDQYPNLGFRCCGP